jgi:hypothetical protein
MPMRLALTRLASFSSQKKHALPCQIERWRNQIEKIDATLTNNDNYEESHEVEEVINDSQLGYSSTNNEVDCSIIS